MNGELGVPSSGPYLANIVVLDMAKGNLRDAMGSLRNLAQLLQSLRIAPKSLSTVLPDVYIGLNSMRRALEQLVTGLRSRTVAHTAVSELESFFNPKLDTLESELRAAMAGPVTAKTRLRLEQIVLKLSQEFDIARNLVDLLVEATTPTAVEVNLLDLIQHTLSPKPRNTRNPLMLARAKLVRDCEDIERKVNPRVITQLCALGVELVCAAPGSGEAHIKVKPLANGSALLVIDREGVAPTHSLEWVAQGVTEPTLVCLQAAVDLAGAQLSWAPHKSRFSIELPAAAETVFSRAAS